MIQQPKTKAEYDALVERLAKASWAAEPARDEWNTTRRDNRDVARNEIRAVLKELGITEPALLPETRECQAYVTAAGMFIATGFERQNRKFRVRIEFLEEGWG